MPRPAAGPRLIALLILAVAVSGVTAAVAGAQPGAIEGRVVARADRRPLPATVRVLGTALWARADTAGRFRIAEVPAGTHEVQASAPGYSAASRVALVEAGRVAEIEIPLAARTLPARGRLAGRVTRDGGAAPVRHAYLSPTAAESEVRSRDDGWFEFPSLKPGWHEVRVVALGFAERRFRALVEDRWTTLVPVDLGASLTQPPAGGPPRPAPAAPPPAEPFVPERPPADSVGTDRQAADTPWAGAVPIRVVVPAGADTLAARAVTVAVADRAGRRVRGLSEGPLPRGRYLLGWDGKDDDGRAVPTGHYRVRVEVDGEAAGGGLTRTP